MKKVALILALTFTAGIAGTAIYAAVNPTEVVSEHGDKDKKKKKKKKKCAASSCCKKGEKKAEAGNS